MILRTLTHTIRYTLTGILLLVVFHNAHWLVGLCLTLWAVRCEVQDTVAAWKREREWAPGEYFRFAREHCFRKPAEPLTASEFLRQIADAIEGQDRIIHATSGEDAITTSVRPFFIESIREGKLTVLIDLPMAHEAAGNST